MEKHIVHNGSNVKISVTYNKGDGWKTKRGYYLHVQPYKQEGVYVIIRGYSGVRKFLHEVTRKSNKSYEVACAMVTDELINSMLEQCKFD